MDCRKPFPDITRVFVHPAACVINQKLRPVNGNKTTRKKYAFDETGLKRHTHMPLWNKGCGG